MRLSRTSGVRPTASKILLHFMESLRLAAREQRIACAVIRASQSNMRPLVHAAKRQGETRVASEHFEWCSMGADCWILARGTDRHDHCGFGEHRDRASREKHRRG